MDLAYLLILQKIREALGGVLDAYMLEITSFAESVPAFLLIAGVYWCVDKRIGQCMGWNTALACTWSQFLKAVCKIERPWVRDARIHPVEAAIPAASGYSFPSGHTARAVAAWGTAGSGAWKKKHTKWLGVLLWGLTALILFSRNYLGVHTPQDVAAALLFGLFFLWIVEKLLDWVEKHPRTDVLVCAAGCLFCFLPMLRVGCMSNAGAGMGLIIGWFVERRLVRFETAGSPTGKCVRFFAGGMLALFLLKTMTPLLGLLMEGKYAGFFAMFFFGFFIMAGYPYCFSRLEGQNTQQCRRRAGILGAGAAGIFLCMMLAFAVVCVQYKQAAAVLEGESVRGGQQAEQVPVEDQRMLLIAHRGYSSAFPENTQPAFSGALAVGVDYIETDVQMTKDGEIVVFHDNDLARITGCEGTVADYTYEELCTMDAGKWFSDAYAGEKIPTLRQMLTLVRDWEDHADTEVQIYLELKDIGAADGFVEAVYQAANDTGMTERCVFASFRYEYLTQFKQLDPNVRVLYNTVSAEAGITEQYPAEFYGFFAETVNAEVISAVHALGRKAFVWTVDTPQRMKDMQAIGADGIATNVPVLAKVVSREMEKM